MSEEVGEGASRELVQLFNKVLLRYMTTGELTEIRKLMDGLGGDGDISPDWYARFHHFQTYYDPGDTEPVWTGDIFETGGNDHQRNYSIVITPKCDLAYGKGDRLKVVYAMKIGYQPEEQRPAFEMIWPDLSFVEPEGEGLSKDAEGFLHSVAGHTKKAKKLPERFQLLRFVCTGVGGFHLLVDLHNVCSIPRVEIEQGWKHKRISRLDSPYIEDLMHRYAALSERVGVPTIPEKVCEAEANRLSGK
jgi:hypothetical protein